MDIVQWLVPKKDGDVGVCFAPAWADRLPPVGSQPALRRRSAPLVSRHIARPLAVAVATTIDDDDDGATRLPEGPGLVGVRFSLSADGEPLLGPRADDVGFASTLGEFVGVVVDLGEAAGLPMMGALPVDERRGLGIVLGSLRGQTRARLADAFLLWVAAVKSAALARGFSASATLELYGSSPSQRPIDGTIEASL
jgi:hypothetical protein